MFERPLKSVLGALADDANDPYWCRRLLEEQIPPSKAGQLRPRLVRALATWASYDPTWFARDDSFGSFWYAPVLGQWTEDMFEEVERLVAIREPSLRHLVLARIWWTAYASTGIGAAGRAARHLLMVEGRHKSPNYAGNLVMTLAATHPVVVLRLKGVLTACPQARQVARSWPALLENDLRLKRWGTYDQRRKVYLALQRAGVTTKRDDRRVSELHGVRKAKGWPTTTTARRGTPEVAVRRKRVRGRSTARRDSSADET